MKTLKLLIPFSLIFLSSCVYSLFPIYIKDTLVFLPELEGTWTDGDSQITFASYGKITDLQIKIEPGENEFIVKNGDTIRDQEYIKAYFEDELKESVTKIFNNKAKNGYRMTIVQNDDTLDYLAKTAKIGERYFLDLYPTQEEINYSEMLNNNYFPVHTFMKLDMSDEHLILTSFDLNNLKELFESNRIRLRHEMVEDNVLITAQPKEIQKFLQIYADDENVLEKPTTYRRINS
jgi:hypothetical protein